MSNEKDMELDPIKEENDSSDNSHLKKINSMRSKLIDNEPTPNSELNGTLKSPAEDKDVDLKIQIPQVAESAVFPSPKASP